MPTVYQRRKPDGTKAEIFSADIWIDGAKVQRSTGCTVKRDAVKEAARIQAEVIAERARQFEPLTLDTLMGRYSEEHAKDLPSFPSVKYHILRLLEIIGRDKKLAELGNADVHHYVITRSKMPVSHATINRELDVLQSAYCMARDRWEHPVRAIRWRDHRFPATDPVNNTIDAEEAREAVRLAATKSQDVADAIELTVYTGVRKNELLTLTRARVSLADRRATVLAKRKARQGYRERPVYLSTPALALLAERVAAAPDDDAPLFDLTNHRKVWEWVREQIGRPEVRWHDLRHTHGTMLGKTTDNTRIISKQLGHTHAQTSIRYVHTEHAQVVEAVETIPALSDRKLVALRPEADIRPEPPAQATSTSAVRSEIGPETPEISALRRRHGISV
jgi:integrase